MSFDLMVFEPSAAPSDEAAFDAWYHELTRWKEGHDYADPQFMTPRLQAWFLEMIQEFPALNGPYAPPEDELDDPRVTDYTLAKEAAYVAFGFPVADAAYETMVRLAEVHELGFFDPQSGVPRWPGQEVAPKKKTSWLGRLFGG